MKIQMINDLGLVKEVKVGFSWTVLFFGALTPIFRGDFIWAILQIIAATLTYGLSHIVFAFIYNKIYIKGLIERGYYPATERGKEILIQKGILGG